MAVAATTELEAINIMLAAIAEAPINSLTGTLPVDAVTARSTLAEFNKEIQSEGWSFNTETDVTLTRDGSNQISLPANVSVKLFIGASPIAASIMLIASSSVVAATAMI